MKKFLLLLLALLLSLPAQAADPTAVGRAAAALAQAGLPFQSVTQSGTTLNITWQGGATSDQQTYGATILTQFDPTGTTPTTLPSQLFPGAQTQFTMSSGGSPWGTCLGWDKNVWFTVFSNHNVGKVTPTGTPTIYTLPTASSNPEFCTGGSDGNVWGTSQAVDKIWKVTPSGTITEIAVTGGMRPQGIATLSNGSMYFCGYDNNTIGRSTPAGGLSYYSAGLTTGSQPLSICTGPGDGKGYFTENNSTANNIGVIDPATNLITEYPCPSAGCQPFGICPDYIRILVWFTENSGGAVTSMTPAGVFTRYPLPAGSYNPQGCWMGADNYVYWVDESLSVIGRLVPETGAITYYPMPISTSAPRSGCQGSDGNNWIGVVGWDKMLQMQLNVNGANPVNATLLSATTTTNVAGSSGSLNWSMPAQASGVKKFVIQLSAYTAGGTTVLTFPTAFIGTPVITSNTSILSIATLTSTAITIPVASSATGTIIVEGF